MGIKLISTTKVKHLVSLESLSKDILERRTSTGSVPFSFMAIGLAHIFGQIISMRVKTLSNTNLAASSHIIKEKASLPVDVHRSKTPFLKLPILEVTVLGTQKWSIDHCISSLLGAGGGEGNLEVLFLVVFLC